MAADETERLRSACRTMSRVIGNQARVLKAAWIEMAQGHPDAAAKWITAATEDIWDGDEWNGTESAQEWLERTEAPSA